MLSALLTLALPAFAQQTSQRCAALKHSLHLENTTIIDAVHVSAGSNVTTPGSCQSSAIVTSAICRVQAVVNTTSSSAVHFEAWLPDEWFGRFLGLGNGGLGGCIDYSDLDYGSNLHFASVGSDNGHDGGSRDGTAFLNHPEVINDFAFRAIHVEAVLGKQIVHAYYGRPHDKSYYLGCSTGGRQGMQSALKFPEDFDGILSGAPAVDFNHLLGGDAMLSRFVGAPHPETSPSFIPAELWPVISAEIMNQCDDLDGVKDGIITDPDQCNFRPEALLCSTTTVNQSSCVTPVDALRNMYKPIFDISTDQCDFRPEALLRTATHQSNCITPSQVDALRNIYQPIFGTKGQLLYTRYDPLAESGGNFVNMFSGDIFSISNDWFKFAIFNDSNHSFDNFSIEDIEFADTINPGGIATWDGHFEPFRGRGGKIITYHGRQDQLISSDNSLRFYNMISSTLSLSSLDDFYRLFLVPGMDHCAGGPGAWAFGQGGIDLNVVNASSHNVLLALVDWVEEEKAPETMVGSNPGTGMQRTHCRYPHKSVFDGTDFVCLGMTLCNLSGVDP